MALVDWLVLVLPLLAILISVSPFLMRYVIFRFYQPRFDVSISAERVDSAPDMPFKWYELLPVQDKVDDERFESKDSIAHTTVSFMNNSDKELRVERIEYNPPDYWRPREALSHRFTQDMHSREGLVYYFKGFTIGPKSGSSQTMPFDPEPESGELSVKVYLSIPASELHLPEFLSDFKLKPATEKVSIEE